jgi:hypothetical protein
MRLASTDALAEQAYLVARGVRRLSLAGHIHVTHAASDELLRVATQVERHAEPNAIPFVLDHGDGIASYGYAESSWALDLYEWAVKDPAVPQEQQHRIIGLLLGYSTPAVLRHEEEGSGRRFAPIASAEPDASSLPCGSASTGEMSPLC